ncbi:DUF3900 domain-containing protein [Bacillus mycoides]|uniref:DUF3900 domain-containing protein n=1 Tax=Bacillus mycoides TaxID=1405 RepID=UPI00103BA32E|nr:DUF3900 domain-containing protein [Bacillus mycoides]
MIEECELKIHKVPHARYFEDQIHIAEIKDTYVLIIEADILTFKKVLLKGEGV